MNPNLKYMQLILTGTQAGNLHLVVSEDEAHGFQIAFEDDNPPTFFHIQGHNGEVVSILSDYVAGYALDNYSG